MSQHFGTDESYAQANIQGSPNPPAEWGVMNSVGGRHREWGGGEEVLKLGGQILLICPTWLSTLKEGSSV